MEELVEAAEAGDSLTLEALLRSDDKRYEHLHKRMPDGRTLLHLAAQANSFACVSVLLEMGANVKEVDGNGLSAVTYATDEHVVDLLIQREIMSAEADAAVAPRLEVLAQQEWDGSGGGGGSTNSASQTHSRGAAVSAMEVDTDVQERHGASTSHTGHSGGMGMGSSSMGSSSSSGGSAARVSGSQALSSSNTGSEDEYMQSVMLAMQLQAQDGSDGPGITVDSEADAALAQELQFAGDDNEQESLALAYQLQKQEESGASGSSMGMGMGASSRAAQVEQMMAEAARLGWTDEELSLRMAGELQAAYEEEANNQMSLNVAYQLQKEELQNRGLGGRELPYVETTVEIEDLPIVERDRRDYVILELVQQEAQMDFQLGHRDLEVDADAQELDGMSHSQVMRKWMGMLGTRELLMPGDGSCQFHSLSNQLFRQRYPKDSGISDALRERLCDHIEECRLLYEDFVTESWDMYIDRMRRGEWGDNITLQAFCNLFGVEVRVMQDNRSILAVRPRGQFSKKFDRILWVSYWNQAHYNSVYPVDDPVFDEENGHVL